MPELISEVTRKAIKPHTCDYCHCEIPKGENYYVYTLKFDDVYRWKSHIRCTEIAKELEWSGYVELDSNGFQAEDFQEAVRELYEEFVVYTPENPTMDEMTNNLFKLFKLCSLEEHKPKGYIEGYFMKERSDA